MELKKLNCPFCKHKELIYDSIFWEAFYDEFPVNPGHVLIVTKRHVSSFFDLTPNEILSLDAAINTIKAKLDKEYNPDGYNIGVNIGEVAGQTVMHCHIHVIPRYSGDVDCPRGGVRGVIPGKQFY